MPNPKYCESISSTQRRPSREVMVGNVGVGANHPIRVQSMTTSDTRDVQATVEQIIRLADLGCEIARITVQGMKEAHACEEIKNTLLQKGYTIPLVADIHFYPPAAMTVANYVDKIRVNPGNYVDRRATFKILEYDDASYQEEIDRIDEKFNPLVQKCKALNRAMRIGTNHGSLSDRIMNRYGDTAQGMVESALEFARVCRKYDYHDFMFSMKASNTHVMIEAYRLLTAKMYELDWDYPLHLGVTEAGEGEDGRVKSAIGIGTLLLDGLGDTIRVSLTEDPWHEIDPCQRIVQLANSYQAAPAGPPFIEKHRVIDHFEQRKVDVSSAPFLHRDGSVILSVSASDLQQDDFLETLGCGPQGTREIGTADGIILEGYFPPETEGKIQVLRELGLGLFSTSGIANTIPLLTLNKAIKEQASKDITQRFALSMGKSPAPVALMIEEGSEPEWHKIEQVNPSIIFLAPSNNKLHFSRHFFEYLNDNQLKYPVILSFSYTRNTADTIIEAAAEHGSLLCDGYGNGIHLRTSHELSFSKALSFNILQGSRMRTIKTEFISCPSCGRTLFNLQDVAKRIRERTDHLPGVKIAIMGCIVNGPGEMADADFGYVGSRPGMIDLYVGKVCVEKNIDFEEADDRLIDLIKAHNLWVEPEELVSLPS